ncbi:MFS-type transporter SLC18B1-like [Homarus americanus]|uniref:MFS-type transporter SLC18B1-like n=1 Tax=Homarus americanus TaxID=6706 RepID=UPI001C447A91|nr:MFS-type transporter SLC18B1-like [Homarus americanus]
MRIVLLLSIGSERGNVKSGSLYGTVTSELLAGEEERLTRLVVAGLAQEEVAARSEPVVDLTERRRDLLVAQVHEQPVAEHNVERSRREIQPAGGAEEERTIQDSQSHEEGNIPHDAPNPTTQSLANSKSAALALDPTHVTLALPADESSTYNANCGGPAVNPGISDGCEDQADVAAMVRLLQETLPRLTSTHRTPPNVAAPHLPTSTPPLQPLVSTQPLHIPTSTPIPSLVMVSSAPFPVVTLDSLTRGPPFQCSPPFSAFSSALCPSHASAHIPCLSPILPFPKACTQASNPKFIHPTYRGFPHSRVDTLHQGFTQSLGPVPCGQGINQAPGMSCLGCLQGTCSLSPSQEKTRLLTAPSWAPGSGDTSQVTATGSSPPWDNGTESGTHSRTYFRFSRRQLLVLSSMILVDFFAFASISIMAPFFPHQVHEMGLSDTLDGIIFSVYSFVMVISSPIIGKFLPLLRLQDVYLVGIMLTGLANISFGMVKYVKEPEAFVVVSISLRALAAVGAACFLTVIYSIVPILFTDNMNTVNGMLETAVGLGMCAGPAVGVWLYSEGGFSLPFYGLGVLILLTIPASYVAFPDDEVRVLPSRGIGGVLKVLGRPGAIVSLLILCASAVCVAVLYPTLQPHMSKLGVSVEGVGLVYLLLSAAYGVSAPLVGLATDRYGCPWGFMLAGLLLTAVSYLLIGNSPLLPHLSHDQLYNQDVIGIVLLGLASALCIVPTYGAILNASISTGEEVDISTFSVVGGLWSATYSLGEMLGPLYAGIMTPYVNFATSTTITVLLPIALAVVLGAYMCARRRSSTT